MAVWDEFIPEEDRLTMTGAFACDELGAEPDLGAQPALLVVDMTYAFVDGRYPIAAPEEGAACVQAIRTLRAAAREAGLPVLYCRGLPARNQADLGRWKSRSTRLPADLPDPTAIVPELEPNETESVVRKRRPSAFFGTELISLLAHHRVDTLLVTGMVTSGCVRATAVDAFSYNLRVIVPEECVADRVRASHAVSLYDIQMKYGQVAPLDAVISSLGAWSSRAAA